MRFAAFRVRPAHRDYNLAQHGWIRECDDQERKQELGLGHYEGRGWPGLHHHATLCIAAYGFLIAERNRFPPLPASARDQIESGRGIAGARRQSIRPDPNEWQVLPHHAASSAL